VVKQVKVNIDEESVAAAAEAMAITSLPGSNKLRERDIRKSLLFLVTGDRMRVTSELYDLLRFPSFSQDHTLLTRSDCPMSNASWTSTTKRSLAAKPLDSLETNSLGKTRISQEYVTQT